MSNIKHVFIDDSGNLREARKNDSFDDIKIYDVPTMANLMGRNGFFDGQSITLRGFVNAYIGGGKLYWDSSKDKADHNGGTVIDPDHSITPGATGWWTSENTGTGCWVRSVFEYNEVLVSWFGVVANGDRTLTSTACQAALVEAYENRIPLTIDVDLIRVEGNVFEVTNTTLASSNTPRLVIRGTSKMPRISWEPLLADDKCIWIDNQDYFHLSNFHIIGDGSGNGDGIYLGKDDADSTSRGLIENVRVVSCRNGLVYRHGFITDIISSGFNFNIEDGIKLDMFAGRGLNAIQIFGGHAESNGRYGLYCDAGTGINLYGPTIEGNDVGNIKIKTCTNFQWWGGYMEGDPDVPTLEAATDAGDSIDYLLIDGLNMVSYKNLVTIDKVQHFVLKNYNSNDFGLGWLQITENVGYVDMDPPDFKYDAGGTMQTVFKSYPQRSTFPFFRSDLREIPDGDIGNSEIFLDEEGRWTLQVFDDDGNGIQDYPSPITGNRAVKVASVTGGEANFKIRINWTNTDVDYFKQFDNDFMVANLLVYLPASAETFYNDVVIRWNDGSTQAENVYFENRPPSEFSNIRDKWFYVTIPIPLDGIRANPGFNYIRDITVSLKVNLNNNGVPADDWIALDHFEFYNTKFIDDMYGMARQNQMEPTRLRPRELDAKYVNVRDFVNFFGTGYKEQQAALGKLNQTISGSYTQAEVQAISDKIDQLIDLMGSTSGYGLTSD